MYQLAPSFPVLSILRVPSSRCGRRGEARSDDGSSSDTVLHYIVLYCSTVPGVGEDQQEVMMGSSSDTVLYYTVL